MGYSLSWLAVHGTLPSTLYEQLGVRETGEPDPNLERSVSGGSVGDWALVVENRRSRFLADSVLGRASAGTTVVAGFVEEHVMHSGAFGWSDGSRRWSVVHEAASGRYHLQLDGSLPSVVREIAARLETRQTEADQAEHPVDYMFNVPVEVTEAITGFRYDRSSERAGFQALESAAPGVLSRQTRLFRRSTG